MLKRDHFQTLMEARTRWTLIIVVAILALLVLVSLEVYYNTGGSLTGKPIAGGGGSGDAELGGGGGIEQSETPSEAPSFTGGSEEPYCGDYKTNNDEECDSGSQGSSTCSENCEFTYCGDGTTQTPNGKDIANGAPPGFNEECDDGNDADNDTCITDIAADYLCQNAYCGDGYVWNTNCNPLTGQCEQCDDGNEDNTDICKNDCTINQNYNSTGFGTDTDQDGITDDQDNCPTIPNGPRLGTCTVNGNSCYPDTEPPWSCFNLGANIPIPTPICQHTQADSDGDGIGDACDGNDDGSTNPPGSNDNDNPSNTGGSSSNSPPQNQNTNSNTEEQSTDYLVDGGNNFDKGEFVQLIVSLNDQMTISIDGVYYVISVFGIADQTLSIEILSPNERKQKVINLLTIEKITLGDNEIALRIDDIVSDQKLAYLTIASIGKTADQTEPVEKVFEQTIEQKNNAVSAKPQEINLNSSFISPTRFRAIIYTIIVIIALIIIVIIYNATKSKNLSKEEVRRRTAPRGSKPRRR